MCKLFSFPVWFALSLIWCAAVAYYALHDAAASCPSTLLATMRLTQQKTLRAAIKRTIMYGLCPPFRPRSRSSSAVCSAAAGNSHASHVVTAALDETPLPLDAGIEHGQEQAMTERLVSAAKREADVYEASIVPARCRFVARSRRAPTCACSSRQLAAPRRAWITCCSRGRRVPRARTALAQIRSEGTRRRISRDIGR